MKLLHVSPSMDPKHGGVCQAVRIIISGLTELGVQNEVVSLDTADCMVSGTQGFQIATQC